MSASLSASAREWSRDLGKAGRYLAQSLRLMVGLPDYDAYLSHMEVTHPGQPVMSYEEFFRERQDARYGGKGQGRCC
jgi:uncharacterized short protein YbdD (DUF466 family)